LVLLGRLALYGPGATRLHEEIIPVTAPWIEATRTSAPLRAFGERGQETTLAQLEIALRDPRRPPPHAVARVQNWARKDAEDLAPELRRRGDTATEDARKGLADRGREQASALRDLLAARRKRILEESAKDDDPQLELFEEAERKQWRLDRAGQDRALGRLARDIETEPAKVEAGYAIAATRLDPVGLVYIWPVTG
jgi:hypothetical protein